MKYLLTVLTCCLFAAAFSQKSAREARAEKRMMVYDYPAAIDLLTSIDSHTPESLSKLAMCYRLTGQYAKATTTYRELDALDALYPIETYYLAALERTQGNYTASNTLMASFAEMVEHDSRAVKTLARPGYFEQLQTTGFSAEVEALAINSPDQDFAPSLHQDQVVFASSRRPVGPVSRTYNRSGLPFLDLYAAKRCDSETLCEPQPFDHNLAGRYHDGPAAFDADGTRMVFTRNNAEKDATGTRRLMLFECERNETGWTEPQPLEVNNPRYSVGHAALSNDGNTLVFASDMPGGFGGTDLYVMYREHDGSWGRPMNLGPAVNTEGQELFPFVHHTGLLFFASDGLPGLGGLDVFVADWKEHAVGEPRNLGFPINDTHDDFGLVLQHNGTDGFYTSNRPGGAGDDDLYAFELHQPISLGVTVEVEVVDENGAPLAKASVVCANQDGTETTHTSDELGTFSLIAEPRTALSLLGQLEGYLDGLIGVDAGEDGSTVWATLVLPKTPELSLECLIVDAQTGAPVEGVLITLSSQNDFEDVTLHTNAEGLAMEPLEPTVLGSALDYTVILTREGYLTKTLQYTTVLDQAGMYALHEAIDLSMEPMAVGADLGSLIDINPIYFDLNKATIRTDAADELDKIVAIMNENPTLEIELGSHTDCRGSAAYNEALSDRRAKASAAYIQARISNPNRITGKGYGESELVNDCGCEGRQHSKCSEESHQENRRTEFVIVKM